MSEKKTVTASADNKNIITFNAAFFAENAANPHNPLNHITYAEKTLYDAFINEEEADRPEENAPDVDLASVRLTSVGASSSMSRDGFVTNQRYQTAKDNKRSEMQRTKCYDEVFTAQEAESEDSNEDDESSRSSVDTSSSSTETLSKTPVSTACVIHMYDEEHDVAEEECLGKKKFERLVQSKELESIKRQLDKQQHEHDEDEESSSGTTWSHVSKYKEEEDLLEKYKSEVKLGGDKTLESVVKATSVLSKLDMVSTSDRYSAILNARK